MVLSFDIIYGSLAFSLPLITTLSHIEEFRLMPDDGRSKRMLQEFTGCLFSVLCCCRQESIDCCEHVIYNNIGAVLSAASRRTVEGAWLLGIRMRMWRIEDGM